ncbi:hypothetical protein ACTHAM_000465 [Cellulomonas soli]|uniref:hypothetical protein n=1 Tax=Cellulomonas soli TaxID=931535 RepID=UPI003F838A84
MQYIATVVLATADTADIAPMRLRRESLAAAVQALAELAQRLGTAGPTRVRRASVLELDDDGRVLRELGLDGRPLVVREALAA